MGSDPSFLRRLTGRTRLPAPFEPTRIETASNGCAIGSNSSVESRHDTIRPENPSRHSSRWPPLKSGGLTALVRMLSLPSTGTAVRTAKRNCRSNTSRTKSVQIQKQSAGMNSNDVYSMLSRRTSCPSSTASIQNEINKELSTARKAGARDKERLNATLVELTRKQDVWQLKLRSAS